MENKDLCNDEYINHLNSKILLTGLILTITNDVIVYKL